MTWPETTNGLSERPDRVVLVTGGTGFLGAALVRRLVASGVRTRVLVRSRTRAGELAASGVEPVVGDITDRSALEEAIDGVTIVCHLAGKLLVAGAPADEYHRIHVEGTRLLLECCRLQPRLERLVHCSTTGVVGITGDRAVDESASFQPTNVYESTKAEAERAIREAWSHRFPAVIVRPGLVYGPGDLHLLGFFRSVLRRHFRPIGHRPVWLHPIYIDDMTEGLVRCMTRPEAVGECFHIAGREPVSLEYLATTIARAAGTSLPPGHIALPVARAVAAVGDHLPGNLKRAAPLTRSRVEFLTHSRIYDVTKARELLGFEAATNLSVGIERSIAWYRQQGYLPAAA